MELTVREMRQKVEQYKGRRSQVEKDCEHGERVQQQLYLQSVYCEEAQTIIQTVAQETQEQLQYHVSELVTLAMAGVFDDPYEFEIEFVQRRGRTEADLWFVRGGQKIHPMSASGGGAVDVASFALRVSLWSLAPVRTRNVLVLDEPLHFLKGEVLPEKGSAMIKEISEKMGLQVIMISHIPDQIEGADRVFNVSMSGGVSKVRQ